MHILNYCWYGVVQSACLLNGDGRSFLPWSQWPVRYAPSIPYGLRYAHDECNEEATKERTGLLH